MTCDRCGGHCHGQLCKDCERIERFSENECTGGTADSEQTDSRHYRCTACGTEYEAVEIGCPECDAHRARYIGELEAHA